MRQQLIQYVDLLFAGAPDAEDVKQEILQNTLDRYDDLITQGRSPEAAYSLAIAGIGDINEILGKKEAGQETCTAPPVTPADNTHKGRSRSESRLSTVAAIAFFILCPIPVLILQNTLGVCLLLAMVAAGVGLLIFFGKDSEPEMPSEERGTSFHRIMNGIVWGSALAGYFVFSFYTHAWYISWLIFPIAGFVSSLISACYDLNKRFLSAVVRIVIFGILILVLTACLLGGYLGVTIFEGVTQQNVHPGGTTASAGNVSASEIRDIEIQWVSGSITIQPGPTDVIVFSEPDGLRDNEKMVWKQSGNRLIIQFCKPRLGLFSNGITVSKDLVITVPEDWVCGELDVDSVSSRITVEQLNVREADIINVSGHCIFKDCSVDDFSIETISGNVHYSGIANILDFDTVSADCTAELSNAPKEAELDAVSGDLILVLPESCGFTLELDSVSGDFTSEYPATVSNNSYRYGDGSCSISADTVSGNVKINAPK